MKHKVSDLEGALLDAAVAKAIDATPSRVEAVDVEAYLLSSGATLLTWHGPGPIPFSSEWMYGGPIIERERIDLSHRDGFWRATAYRAMAYDAEWRGVSVTPLIAAMRAYVASKLGDEIDL